MKLQIKNLENQDVGSIDVDDDIFGQDTRPDILARVVNWQLAKRRSGNHKTKGISEVRGGGRKPWNQKGSGRARQGSSRSPQWRKGAVIFGPHVRDHGFDLPKKVRKLGLKCALSTKQAEGRLVILDSAKLDSPRTKALAEKLSKLGLGSVLLIDGPIVDVNFARAAANIPLVDVLPQQGANVYDIMRRDTLVLTRDAIQHLAARLK